MTAAATTRDKADKIAKAAGAAGNTTAPARSPRKAAFASWIGSAVEYYDFFIYGTAAALVFGKIFFPAFDPATATVAAFATFGVGYVTRPFGAVLLGHVGDRYGRKRVLTFTLLLMGISTFLVGLLPTYGQVGIAAPIMLVVLRMLQGISAAGEQAGANSMTLEHAPAHRRAFFTSFTLSGTQAGLILATLVFLPLSALPEEQLLSWGWRIPFFLSAIVVAVGMWVRRTLPETPAFAEESGHKPSRMPLALLFRDHKANLLRVIFAALVSVVSTIFSVFTLSYAVNTMHIPRSTMLTVLVLANVVALGAIPLFAALSDRVGRKPVFIFGALGSAALIWPYMWSISTVNLPLVFTFGLLLSGVVYSAANGVWPSLYGEMFSTRVRLSGMAIGTQVGFALGGFAPTISAAVLQPGPGGWIPVAAFVTATSVVAAISVATARETFRLPMHELGNP
ncbi:MFS transporter [Duganella sp. BJB488]|uniref:MFS transporter n=1 Tax=unclassified Duganella TaxID=2636909 RepID=UPI000E356466|nr:MULTISPECIES: MFS transporter [unclassified Duganella]RFP17813.1 MFS transporter [Duganella sp. BJB489]RFP22320.1 MFS transporter [Duganella sp. BJB488]RFP37654.1 MFS transporter [Duganella sp. BJB480]